MELASTHTSKCVTLDTTSGHFPDRTPACQSDGTDSQTRDFWLRQRKNKISGKDTRPVCSNCLGVDHTRLSLDVFGSCGHCKEFTVKSLRNNLAHPEPWPISPHHCLRHSHRGSWQHDASSFKQSSVLRKTCWKLASRRMRMTSRYQYQRTRRKTASLQL